MIAIPHLALCASRGNKTVGESGEEQVRKVLWTRKGVRATVVTAGHCTHAELSSGHALASCYSCCVHSCAIC